MPSNLLKTIKNLFRWHSYYQRAWWDIFISSFPCLVVTASTGTGVWVSGFLCMKFCVCSTLCLLLSTPLIPEQSKHKGWWSVCQVRKTNKHPEQCHPFPFSRAEFPSQVKRKTHKWKKSSHWTKPFSCFSLLYQFLVPGVQLSYWCPDKIFTAAEHRLHTEWQGPALKPCWEIFSLGTLLYFYFCTTFGVPAP